jgi:hypothetical protein
MADRRFGCAGLFIPVDVLYDCMLNILHDTFDHNKAKSYLQSLHS